MKKKFGILAVFLVMVMGGIFVGLTNKSYRMERKNIIDNHIEVKEMIDKEVERAKKIEAINIKEVVLAEDIYIVLDGYGNVWKIDMDKTVKDAKKIAELQNVIKIVDVGSAVYALTESGEVYAWGCNKELMIAPDVNADQIYEKPIRLGSLTNIVDIDGGNGKAFAIDSSGRLFMWGFNIYPFNEQNMQPGFPEKEQNLVENVKEIYMGAGNFHYFQREDGTFFSIMDPGYRLDHLKYLIFPCFPGETIDLNWWEDTDVIDLREGTKDGLTYLYEMKKNDDISILASDEYTMYLYQKDNTLWYWNSDRIKYHDKESAGALVETANLDYDGYFEKVDIEKILQVEESGKNEPKIVSICSGKENVLFLFDNGQVVMSKYITKEIKDVEYYNTSNTRLDREIRTSVEPQMHLKELSFQKLDYENIVSISSDKDRNFFLVDKWGNIYRYITED